MTFEQVKGIRDGTSQTDQDILSRLDKFDITFDQVISNLDLLCDLLAKSIAEFNIEMTGKKVKYWVNVNTPKRETRGKYNWLIITGKGTYFDKREILSISDSGWIGFCCEADCQNEIPILRAFGEWLHLIGGGII
jgi:hypothetical protein